jgi:hypothetical protein
MTGIKVLPLALLFGTTVLLSPIVTALAQTHDFECGTEDSVTYWNDTIDTLLGICLGRNGLLFLEAVTA